MANSPTLVEAIRRAMEASSSEICTALPARVESYDAAAQRASVQPLIRRTYQDESGARQVERLPVISDVPVSFPGAGDYSISWPLAKGDIVLLVFSQASIDKWLTSGKDVDPLDDRRHSLNDAIAIPGLRAFGGKGAAAPIPSDGLDDTALVIRAPEIHAGGDAALALKADVEHLRSKLNGLTCSGGTLNITGSPADAMTGTSVLKGG